MATPPGAFPIIGDSTTVRFRLSALMALIFAIVGAAIWLTSFYLKQAQLAEWAQSADRRLQRIERALGIEPERLAITTSDRERSP